MSTRATMVAIQGVFKVDDMEDTIFQRQFEQSPDLDAVISIEQKRSPNPLKWFTGVLRLVSPFPQRRFVRICV
jgi:hypothetical protein